MKAISNKKVIAKKVNDCKGLKSFIGLRFKKGFGKYDAYLIHMFNDSILDSYFVYQKFIAIWIDKKGKVLEIKKCDKNKFYPIVKGQKKVLEFPINSKIKLRKGEIISFKV